MNRTVIRYLIRGVLFLLAILLLVYMNSKEGVNLGTIAKFKLETFNKINTDSLNNKDKVDVLVEETTKFSEQINDDTSNVQDAIYGLVAIMILLIVSELIFFNMQKKASADKNQT